MERKFLCFPFLALLLSSCVQSGESKIAISEEPSFFSLHEVRRIEAEGVSLPEGDLTYSSSDPSILKIDPSSGMAEALKEGEAEVEVSSKSKPSLSVSFPCRVGKGEAKEYTYHDLNLGAYRDHSAPSKGEVSILLIPVSIKGFEEEATAENLARIDSCFNGEGLDRFESVSSYYEKSSYGQLHLDFKMPDRWYETGLTPEGLQALQKRDDLGVSQLALDAVAWYEEAYPETDLREFDSDGDGFLDGVWLIYDAPVMGEDPSHYKKLYPDVDPNGFWAYTLSDYLVSDEDASLSSPSPKMVSWAGLGFLDGYGEGRVDAHTYIHETGHMLGLKDYYSTYSPYDCPAGCVDMMDNNVGDHCAFSKYALGWVSPIVSEGKKSFHLPSFQETGSFLLLASPSWNKTPFDEYFTVEFLTPNGLNEEDSASPYPGNGVQGYSKPGVRISHIDNRCVNRNGRFESDPSSFYNDPISNTANATYTRFLDSKDSKTALYLNRLVQKNLASAEATILDSSRAYYNAIRFKEREDGETSRLQSPDGALFYGGDSFDLSEGSPYRELMSGGGEFLDKHYDTLDPLDSFPYRLTVREIDEGGAWIDIEPQSEAKAS